MALNKPTRVTPSSRSQNKTMRTTVADEVYQTLRSQLIAGAFTPGQKLTLRGLAEQFGTSVMPVREAVRRLTAQGGLQINPNRTIEVRAPTSEEFDEMLKIRSALEGLACENAVKRMRDSEITRIRQLEQRFEREALRLRPNPEVLARIYREFHFSIYRASRMPQLIALIENLWVQVSPVLTLAIRHTAQGLTMRDSLRHHTRLVDSINKRDAARARHALVADIREAGELILRSGLLRQYDVNTSADNTTTSHRQYKLT